MQTTTRVLLLSTALGLLMVGGLKIATAQILEKDPPGLVVLNGNDTSLSERDLAIDPTDGILPANGTLSMSMAGATDIDIQSMIPFGMSIILDNQTATVTNQPVDIGNGGGADSSNGNSNGGDD